MSNHHFRPRLAGGDRGGGLRAGRGGVSRRRQRESGPRSPHTLRAEDREGHDASQGSRNCPNKGIVIRADDVTLDLNGHTIDGDGTEFAGCANKHAFCDVGILNDGHDGVTVKHGSVRQFAFGVFAVSRVGTARHNGFRGISASRNRFRNRAL